MAINNAQLGQARLVSAVQEIRKQRRTPRNPQHSWAVKAKPYEIAPIMCAPVLPGETMKDLNMQARVVSDPLLDPFMGWWQEFYFVYVPLPGLFQWDDTGLLQEMMLNPATDVSALKADANSDPYFTFNGGMDFVKECTRVVVEEFFRDEGELAADHTIENYFSAQLDRAHWAQSMKLEAAGEDDAELPGVDEIEELDILPGFSNHYAQWEMMRDSGYTDLTYDDWRRSYGVTVPKAETLDPAQRYTPELLRYFRKWKTPSPNYEIAGAGKATVVWDVRERADKDRFFKYPGFIMGFTLTRPKVFLGSQKGAAVGMLSNAYAWQPPVLAGYPYTSIAEQIDSDTTGILQNQPGDYWVDLKDLFLHGDQFRNYAVNSAMALPDAAGNFRYPTEAMVDALFVTAGQEYIKQDGAAFLTILSRMVETTP